MKIKICFNPFRNLKHNLHRQIRCIARMRLKRILDISILNRKSQVSKVL